MLPNTPAVLCHVYYYDVWPDLAGYIANVPHRYHLHVSITESDTSGHMAQKVRDAFPHAVIHILPNLGRDMLPMLTMLAALPDDVGPWAFLHSKKSTHVRNRRAATYGETWRRQLLNPIMGSEAKVRAALDAFDDPLVGIVAARQWVYPVCQMDNYAGRDRLLAAMDISKPVGKFVAGTMFWGCPALRQSVLGWKLNSDDFIAHHDRHGHIEFTIERMLGVATYANMRHIKTV